MTLLIAEIGNAHFGSMDSAKELIYEAKQSGADLVKGQAFDYKTIKGSMPKDFYKDCCFNNKQLNELMDYADKIGVPLFFSIFSDGFSDIRSRQSFHKIAANQSFQMTNKELQSCDHANYFISINQRSEYPKLINANVLYASSYLPNISPIGEFSLFQKRYPNCGYSDHTIGIVTCIEAVALGASVIEKHICLRNYQESHGKIFRDTIHGITPKELYKLSKIIKE